MSANKAMALIAVAILIACPTFVVFANIEDSNAETKEYATSIEIVGASKDDAETVLNLDCAQFFPLLNMKTENAKCGILGVVEWNPTKVNDSIGLKRTLDSDKLIVERFVDLSFDFTLKIKALADKAKVSIIEMDNYSGEAKTELVNFLGQELKKDQVMEISGSIVIKTYEKITNEYNVNQEGQYILKDRIGAITAKAASNILYKSEGKSLETKSETKTDYTQETVASYTQTWDKVKTGDIYKMEPEAASIKKLDSAMTVKTMDKELKMNIDLNAAAKKVYRFVEETGLEAKWLTPEQNDSNGDTISSKVKFSEIDGLSDNAKKLTDEQIKQLVEKIKGKTTTNVSEFNKKTDSIKSDVNSGSSSNNDMWIWIAVAVVVILIIAALAFWYFKYRKPSA